MKKRIFLLATFTVVALISIVFLIPMINYVITYEDWFSFMTFNRAVFTVICLFIMLLSTAIGIVLVALNMNKYQANKYNESL